MRKGEDWAFVDAQGRMVIPFGRYRFQRPAFRETLSGFEEGAEKTYPYFQEGLCPVYSPSFGDKQVGYINRQGALVIPYRYYKASHFYGGKAWAVVPSDDPEALKPYQSLQIDKKGRVLAELFDEARLLRKERLMVQSGFKAEPFCVARQQSPEGTRFLYLDMKGQIAIKGPFLQAHPFSEGLAAVMVERKKAGPLWGFINEKGKWAISPQWQAEPEDFAQGLALVEKVVEGKAQFQFIDRTGEVILTTQERGQAAFTAGQRIIRDGTALESLEGEMKALPAYSWVEGGYTKESPYRAVKLLSDGAYLIFVRKQGKNHFGLMGPDHFPQITPVFDQLEASEAASPLFARMGEKEGFVNRQGLFVLLLE